uniref:Hemolymph proteinase 18 n=1 Tax=Manduca sexta TaxID=7130 RepID=Q5MPB6_MANSE|nr:hemolymph proteinase 18 [Manduca sexta]
MVYILIILVICNFSCISCQSGTVESRIHFKDEGPECYDANKKGTCVSAHRCLDVVRKLKDGEKPTICGYQGTEPMVCCTDCTLVDNISNLVVSSISGYLWKDGQKAWDKCLEYVDKLSYPCASTYSHYLSSVWEKDKECSMVQFVGVRRFASYNGQPAKRNEYPHMALLGYGDDQETAQWLCGGSVISDQFILTAAHCIFTNLLGPVRFAALGILQRSDPVELWQVYKIGGIVPHPQYKSPIKYHDIALLKTENKIKFNENVLPACLFIEGRVGGSEQAKATGWGALGHKQTAADVLQVVDLQKFSDEECGSTYRPYRHLPQGYDSATQMCYGDKGKLNMDTCEGDSGGPLQFQNSSLLCIHIVAGVTSFGDACGFAGGAGMYTRVSYYIPWIESVVWP